ncbi:MAG: hypothetical protein K1000chlam3_01781, partial [Chlamydiae bacterium]|nr:hypothetical protein [Chlamydiota bacterium]
MRAMKFRCFFLSLFFLISPLGQIVSDEDTSALKEFDDDAFLSAKTEPNPDGLIGWSLFSSDGEDKYIINFN